MGSQILRTKAPSALAKPLPPNYHALVTPVLHRRFVRSSWTTLTIAYVGNILMENISGWPWSAFPLGRAGLNTLVLFFFLLPVLILRIAQLTTTSNKSLSDVHCLVRSVTNRSLAKSIFYYTLSAWLIIQFYLWNTLPSSDLSMTKDGMSSGIYEINERPLYLLYYAFPLGTLQGFIHIWTDRDYVRLQAEEKTFWQAFTDSTLKSLQRICTTIVVSIFTGPASYFAFRGFIRGVGLLLFGMFFKIQHDSQLPAYSDMIDVFFRSVWLTLLIVIAWEATNISFAVEFSKGPIREGKTISEISPDPNGSLILGLKLRKKPLSRRMAFRELSFIAKEMASRRETIFKELTKPVCTLVQIITECREAIGPILTTLAPPQAVPANTVDAKSPSPIKEIQGFSPQKPLEENVLRTPTKSSVLDKWQATPGNMPKSPINLGVIRGHLVKKEEVESKAYDYLKPVLRSQYGDAFRLTLQRKTTTLLPEASMQLDAISALEGFALASLKEDLYGTVQKELPVILEEMMRISSTLEKYIENPPVHWTDIHSKQILAQGAAPAKEELLPEAVSLLKAVNTTLRRIGEAFEPYYDNLGLSIDVRRKIRAIREVAAKNEAS